MYIDYLLNKLHIQKKK